MNAGLLNDNNHHLVSYHNNSHQNLTHIRQSVPIGKNSTLITIDILIHVKDINDQMISLQYLYQFNMHIYSNKISNMMPIDSGDNLNNYNDNYTCSLTSDNKCSIYNHDKDEDKSNHNYGNNDNDDNDDDNDDVRIKMYGMINDDVKLFCDRYYLSETVCSNVYTKVRSPLLITNVMIMVISMMIERLMMLRMRMIMMMMMIVMMIVMMMMMMMIRIIVMNDVLLIIYRLSYTLTINLLTIMRRTRRRYCMTTDLIYIPIIIIDLSMI